MSSFSNKFLFFLLLIYLLLKIIFAMFNISLSPIFISLVSFFLLIYLQVYLKTTYFLLNKTTKYLLPTFIIELIYLIFLIYLGIFIGFAKSPFPHELISILKNLFIYIIPLISFELTRHLLVNQNISKKHLNFIVILFILIEINYPSLILSFKNKELFFEFLTSNILPLIFKNLLFTYLTQRVPLSTIFILTILENILLFLLPTIPLFNWFSLGALKMLKLGFTYLTFKYFFLKPQLLPKNKSHIFITYAFILIIATILVCFMLGIFRFKPLAILSNSMNPIFSRGDILIYETPPDPSELTVGDILIFKRNNIIVAHRLFKINKVGNTYTYQTKGDNNNTIDSDNLNYDDILGTYCFSLKYLGYPSIWLHEFFQK